MLYCTVSVDGMGWLLIYLGTTRLPMFDAVLHGRAVNLEPFTSVQS